MEFYSTQCCGKRYNTAVEKAGLLRHRGFQKLFEKEKRLVISFTILQGSRMMQFRWRLLLFPRSNEPSSRACTDIWRMPRGPNNPQLCKFDAP